MRKISEVARDIQREWGVRLSPHARPYLYARAQLDGPSSTYGVEDGKTIVLYFLCNASGFRGEAARRLKAELKQICGIK